MISSAAVIVLVALGLPAKGKAPATKTAEDPVARAKSVLERAVGAAGGREALGKITSMHWVGTEQAPGRHDAAGAITFQREIFWKAPGRLKQVKDWPQNEYGPETYAWNATEGWYVSMGNLTRDNNVKILYDVWRWSNMHDLMLDVDQGAVGLTWLREDKIDGEPVDVIEARREGGQGVFYSFSKKTGHLRRYSMVIGRDPALGEERHELFYDDYRQLPGGITLPTRFKLKRINKFVNEVESLQNFATIRINPEIADEEFALPKSLPATRAPRAVPKPPVFTIDASKLQKAREGEGPQVVSSPVTPPAPAPTPGSGKRP